MTPIEKLISEVEMTPLSPLSVAEKEGLPYATHQGILNLAGHKFTIHQLSDGRRILDAEDVLNFMGLPVPDEVRKKK